MMELPSHSEPVLLRRRRWTTFTRMEAAQYPHGQLKETVILSTMAARAISAFIRDKQKLTAKLLLA